MNINTLCHNIQMYKGLLWHKIVFLFILVFKRPHTQMSFRYMRDALVGFTSVPSHFLLELVCHVLSPPDFLISLLSTCYKPRSQVIWLVRVMIQKKAVSQPSVPSNECNAGVPQKINMTKPEVPTIWAYFLILAYFLPIWTSKLVIS